MAAPIGDDENKVNSVRLTGSNKSFNDVEGQPKAGTALIATGGQIQTEMVRLIKETNAPKSANELLKTYKYKGREDELLRHLRR